MNIIRLYFITSTYSNTSKFNGLFPFIHLQHINTTNCYLQQNLKSGKSAHTKIRDLEEKQNQGIAHVKLMKTQDMGKKSKRNDFCKCGFLGFALGLNKAQLVQIKITVKAVRNMDA